MTNNCPRCDSPAPHLHPAVQFEGEVETCAHDFHLRPTPQNKPEYIERVKAKQRYERMVIEDAHNHIPYIVSAARSVSAENS